MPDDAARPCNNLQVFTEGFEGECRGEYQRFLNEFARYVAATEQRLRAIESSCTALNDCCKDLDRRLDVLDAACEVQGTSFVVKDKLVLLGHVAVKDNKALEVIATHLSLVSHGKGEHYVHADNRNGHANLVLVNPILRNDKSDDIIGDIRSVLRDIGVRLSRLER
jgi:hypothetical protein